MARTRAPRRTTTIPSSATTSATLLPDQPITRRSSALTTTARTRTTISSRWSPRSRSPDPLLVRRVQDCREGFRRILFVAEAANRVEVGSFHGGINPKKQADAEGNQQAHQRPEHRDAGGQRGNEVGHADAEDDAGGDAYDAADAGERHGFEKKLREEISAAGADGFADAHSLRPLGACYH